MSDWNRDPAIDRGKRPTSKPAAVYSYGDVTLGAPPFEVIRWSNPVKTFRMRRYDGKSGKHIWNVNGLALSPYRLAELVASKATGEPVFVCEGEKDADNVAALGLIATCKPGGAGGFDWGTMPERWREWFAGRDVVILPDNDEPGRRYALDARRFLADVARTVRTVALPGLAEHGDASDWIAAGGTREALLDLASSPIEADEEDDGDAVSTAEAIREMNEEYAVAWSGGDVVILREHYDPTTARDVVTFAKHDGVKKMLANRFVVVVDPETGESKRKALFPYWMSHGRRRTYRSVVFEPRSPGEPDTANHQDYNLFRGWAVEPDPSKSCQLFLAHVREVICGGDEDDARWLVAWLAQAAQRPRQRPGTNVVLRGGQGVGKGLFAQYVGRMYGVHFVHLQDKQRLVGRFNDHLKNALMVFADEVIFGGDRASVGILNAIVTEDTVMIEPKFHDAMAVRNHMRLVMATNERWAVPTGHDARRFFMPSVSDRRRDDRGYFDALKDEMDRDGPAALLAYLTKLDIRDVDLKVVPKTAELAAQKSRSLTSEQKWWYERLQLGELVDDQYLDGQTSWPVGRIRPARGAVYQTYVESARDASDRYRVTEKELWLSIDEMCADAGGRPLIKRSAVMKKFTDWRDPHGAATKRSRLLIVPQLAECREAFERWYGHAALKWDADDTEGNVAPPTAAEEDEELAF